MQNKAACRCLMKIRFRQMCKSPRMIAEGKQKGERNNAAKFHRVSIGNALAVTEIPQLGW